jgi:hypothetical protein
MDDFLWDTQAMEGMLLHAIQKNELGDDIDVTNTFFKSLKSTSTTLSLVDRGQGLPN